MEKRPTYLSIQALRGVASLLVVLFHLRIVEGKFGSGETLLPSWLNFGYAGVDLFFVISGFVMATVAKGRCGSFSEAGRFLRKRAWRVLPLYWLYTTVVVVLMALVPSMVNTSYQNQSALASYLLWPQSTLPLLSVGWTLVFEFYFYLMTAMAIALLPQRFFLHFLYVWAAVVAIGWTMFETTSPVLSTAFSPMAWEFIAGALVAMYWRRIPAAWGAPLLWAGAVAFIAAMLLLDRLDLLLDGGMYRVAIFGVASSLVVAGAVVLEASRRASIPAWLMSVGDSSYSLYLSHVFVISASGRLWQLSSFNTASWQHAGFIALTVLACVIVGQASNCWLERPLLSLEKVGRSATTLSPPRLDS
ncbi:MAG: acyltransferase family protein [Pseudomonas sp.]|uniref:acyltransferase family protein n=1 Tax=Pseudomonas sp. TaxID=306 RepID=UPI003D70047F